MRNCTLLRPTSSPNQGSETRKVIDDFFREQGLVAKDVKVHMTIADMESSLSPCIFVFAQPSADCRVVHSQMFGNLALTVAMLFHRR